MIAKTAFVGKSPALKRCATHISHAIPKAAKPISLTGINKTVFGMVFSGFV
jgi:hypothetical protein